MLKIKESILSNRFLDDSYIYDTISKESKKYLIELQKKCKNDYKKSKHYKCPLCNGKEMTLIAKKDKLGVNINVLVCKNCNFVFNESIFYNEVLVDIYKNYFTKIYWDNNNLNDLFKTKIDKKSFSYYRYKYILDNLPNNSFETVVEIGCGMGTNLYHFLNHSKRVIGFDFDDEYMAIGKEHGIEMFNGGDEAFFNSDIVPKLVILSHIVEHLSNLDEFFSKLYNKLDENSFVFIEVPGILGWIKKHSKQLFYENHKTTNDFLSYLQFIHNYHFTAWHLIQFCEKNGFEVITYDEMVRLIIKKGNKKSKLILKEDIVSYLIDVENHFLGWSNFIKRNGKKIKLFFKN